MNTEEILKCLIWKHTHRPQWWTKPTHRCFTHITGKRRNHTWEYGHRKMKSNNTNEFKECRMVFEIWKLLNDPDLQRGRAPQTALFPSCWRCLKRNSTARTCWLPCGRENSDWMWTAAWANTAPLKSDYNPD